MSISYFKRFRMEIDLRDAPPPVELPVGYCWVPWHESLIDHHAEVQYLAFCDEVDSHLFPCFSQRAGCQHLLREVRSKAGFLPAATWLICQAEESCGTVQGMADVRGYGAIQNIGVVPNSRNLGLGTALICQALHGFSRSGLKRAYLEVTAENTGAIHLYQRLGFRKMKTLYKAVVEEDLALAF